MKTKMIFACMLLLATLHVAGQNPRNSLIEKGSSTACDECICIDSIMQNCVIPAYPNTIMLIYHDWGSGLKCDMCDTLTFYLMKDNSEVRTNRDGVFYEQYGFANFPKLCDSVKENIRKHPDAPVAMGFLSKNYNSVTRVIDFTVSFAPYGQDLTGTFLVNAVLYENRVLYIQSMDEQCGGFSGTRPCYHHQVVRLMAHQFGEVAKEGAWPVGAAISRDFSFTIDQKWDPVNMFVVVYVYKQNASLLNSEIQQAVLQSVTGPLGQDELAAGLFAIGNIFPNPVSGVAVTNIKVTASGKLMIDITDMNGQLIKPVAGKQLLPGFYDVTFETAGMAPGQYLLRVTSNGQVRSKQFTVLKQ